VRLVVAGEAVSSLRRVSEFRGDETLRAAPCLHPIVKSRSLRSSHLFSTIQITYIDVATMALTRRIAIIASSVFLILVIALSLATAIEVRAPPTKIIQVKVAQAAKIGESERVIAAKARVNGTDFDRVDVFSGTSVVPGSSLIPGTQAPTPAVMTATDEGMLGMTPTPRTSAGWHDEGEIGPIITSSAKPVPAPRPPPTTPQLPIVALSYASSGGPKHCRGRIIQQMRFPRPLEQWKNGTCVNLPSEARCGQFISSKGDNCEAQLFNMRDCYNTSKTYVNTVVFMPEERPVGALWSSMWVKCGVEVPEAKMLDPALLGGALKPKPKPGGG
jgi:hypothetical protein